MFSLVTSAKYVTQRKEISTNASPEMQNAEEVVGNANKRIITAL